MKEALLTTRSHCSFIPTQDNYKNVSVKHIGRRWKHLIGGVIELQNRFHESIRKYNLPRTFVGS